MGGICLPTPTVDWHQNSLAFLFPGGIGDPGDLMIIRPADGTGENRSPSGLVSSEHAVRVWFCLGRSARTKPLALSNKDRQFTG